MVFGIGGGIGPFKVFIPIGGRRRRYRTSDDPTMTFILIGIALVAGGGWATVEGLQGRWGVTGVVFGVLFIIGTVLSLASRTVGTGFLTSWVYWGLSRSDYFELGALPGVLLDRYSDWGSVDEFMLYLLSALLFILNLALVLLGPPLVVFWLLTRLHIAMGLIEVVPPDAPVPPSQIPTRTEPSTWQDLKQAFRTGYRSGSTGEDDPPR